MVENRIVSSEVMESLLGSYKQFFVTRCTRAAYSTLNDSITGTKYGYLESLLGTVGRMELDKK